MCNESFYHELTHYQMLPRKEKLGLEGSLSFNTLAKRTTIYNYPSNLVISSLLAHFQIFELECALSFAYSNPHLYCKLWILFDIFCNWWKPPKPMYFFTHSFRIWFAFNTKQMTSPCLGWNYIRCLVICLIEWTSSFLSTKTRVWCCVSKIMSRLFKFTTCRWGKQKAWYMPLLTPIIFFVLPRMLWNLSTMTKRKEEHLIQYTFMFLILY